MRPAVLIIVLAVVGVATALALRYGAGRLDATVASTVERYGSALTGTRVDVDGVDLALSAGRVVLAGLTVGNPRGYETDYAVRVGSATVDIDVGSLAGDVPVISELVLDGALINAEQRDAGSNLTDIQEHATASSGGTPAGDPDRIVIERFRLRNATVLVTSEYLESPQELPLRDVVVDGIGIATGGATYSEAAEAMLLPVLTAARSAAAERLRDTAAEAVSDAAREELEEEAQRVRERTDGARREVSERVEELLDRG